MLIYFMLDEKDTKNMDNVNRKIKEIYLFKCCHFLFNLRDNWY